MKLPVLSSQDGEANSTITPLAGTKPIPPVDNSYLVDGYTAETLMPSERRSFRWLWITLGVILALLLAAYIGLAIFFMSHFTFNTTVNGLSAAFLTADEVDERLAQDIGTYTLELQARENQVAHITGATIDLRYVADGQIEKILSEQAAWAWPLSLIPEHVSTIQHASAVFDEQKLATAISELAIMNEAQVRTPVDATLDFEGNAYVIIPGDEGTELDGTRLQQVVTSAINDGKVRIDLEGEDLYLKPAVRADDPTLVSDRDTFNKYVPFRITYTIGDRTEVLDGHTTIDWVDLNGEPPYELDGASVEAWVANLADTYDTLGKTRPLTNGFGEEKTVTGGTYGWQIDKDAEFLSIMNAASLHTDEERAPYMLGTAASLDAQDWGTTYLEVDLTRQYMWYFVNGEIAFETDIISGNPNTGGTTPDGVYTVFSKSVNVVLRGPRLSDAAIEAQEPDDNGKRQMYEWESPVSYWMPFTYSGCGFHDANWQSSFGGDAFLYRGSHGCINMPPSLAGELYGMVEVGTPVVVHY